MISNTRYWFLVLFIFLVYVAGMFSILFENDSAQFAVMAMRMFQENDFINLFKGTEEYLDKPHMHYWLAALSFKIFGLHDWAYRIPGILASILAAYSCFGLGRLLYNSDVGKLASLIFLTAQTIVLSNIDLRTDAVLTGFTVFAIWQLATYVKTKKMWHIVLGAFGAGMAFSTKGQIAILVIGLPLVCHLAYNRKWKVLLNWRVLVALVVFGLTITPMLYAYYLQFDLHPEKLIRGTTNRSGIFFIFWEQSFERLSGQGMGKNSSDYFFFFHTFLWVFLPWTVIGLIAYVNRAKAIFKLKFKNNPIYEFLTLGGITLIFILISFAQFKLPHYLNITIPLFAVLTASYLHSLYILDKKKLIKFILGAQYFILSLVFIVSTFIIFFVFKTGNIWHYVVFGSMALIAIYYSLKRESYYLRIITLAAYSAILLNMVLNLHFYPSLLNYQGGSAMAKVITDKEISTENIYKLSDTHTWALDFYNKKPVKIISVKALEDMHSIWIYTTEEERKQLRESGFDWDREHEVDQFRITRLQLKFLNNATRNRVLRKRYLIHIY